MTPSLFQAMREKIPPPALTGEHSERQTFAFTAPLSGLSALVDLFAHIRDAVRRHEGR